MSTPDDTNATNEATSTPKANETMHTYSDQSNDRSHEHALVMYNTQDGDGEAEQAEQDKQAEQDEEEGAEAVREDGAPVAGQYTGGYITPYTANAMNAAHTSAFALRGNFRVTGFQGMNFTLASVEEGFNGQYGFKHGGGTFEIVAGGEAYDALRYAYTNGLPIQWVFLAPTAPASVPATPAGSATNATTNATTNA